MMNDMTMMMDEYDVIGINQCLCLPKAELNTKNSSCLLVKPNQEAALLPPG